MRDAWKLLLVAAASLLALGLLLGNFRTVYEGPRDCGTAFTRTYSPQSSVCNEALSDARMLSWVLMSAGAAFGIGAIVVSRQRQSVA